MFGIIRFIIFFVLVYIAWIFFKEILFVILHLQKHKPKKHDGVPYNDATVKRQPPIDYSDVKDATFHEFPDESKPSKDK
ncbi:MAG: hypothetical protein KBG83_07875 [Bacteroidetes bacterium]|nr:hypothetical protein [Bacteroidota bacterium]